MSVINIKYSSIYIRILHFMLKEGFVRGFFVNFHDNIKTISVLLKYENNNNFLRLKFVNQYNYTLNMKVGNFDYVLSFVKGYSSFVFGRSLKVPFLIM